MEELSKLGDPLEKLNKFIKWEDLRGILTKALKKEPKKPWPTLGRKFSNALSKMFKIVYMKGYRNRPLTKTQERNNKAKSRIRARVEHVFARMHQFGGIAIRTIGIMRAELQIGLLNMAYNMTRYAYLRGLKA